MKPARTDPCLSCMTYHPPPPCTHNADQPCPQCGKPRGYRWTDDPGDGRCWFCVTGRERAA